MQPRTIVAAVVWWSAGCRPEPEDTGLTATCEPTDNVLRQRCTVEADPPSAVSVRYGPVDGSSPERVVDSETSGSTHVLELSILRAETEYAFVASAVDGGAESSGRFVTGVLPSVVGSSLAVTGESSVALIGTDVPCSDAAVGVVYETATGAVVWYELLDPDGRLTPTDMIQFTEDHTILGETGEKIVEVDLSGRVLLDLVRGWDYADDLHHDLFKRDGLIYAIRALESGGAPGPGNEPEPFDGFYVFDAAAGVLVEEWDAPSFLSIPDAPSEDWMHTNTIWVDEGGDIYLSSFGQNTVIKLVGDRTSADFGTQLWALAGAGPAGFGSDYDIDWGTGEVGFQHQHAVHRLDDGTLVLLDNAHGRALAVGLDEGRGVATVLAEYPVGGRDECGPQGTAAVTAAGNVLVGCSSGWLQEYTPDGSVAWTASIRGCVEQPIAARFYPLDGW